MTVNELIAQLDGLGRDEKMQVLDPLIEDLEHESARGDETQDKVEEALWDESFAKSQDVLARMAARARQNRDQGLNRELDPDEL